MNNMQNETRSVSLTAQKAGFKQETHNSNNKLAQVSAKTLSQAQLGAIKYFYGRLLNIYGAEYRRHIPDDAAERASKGEYAPHIMNFTKEKIDRGFLGLHEDRQRPDSEYKFFNLDAIIGLVKNGGGSGEGNPAGAHKPFYPNGLQLEDKTAKEKRKKEGVKNCAKLKSLFD